MEAFKKFLIQYRGALIGIVIAVLILLTHLYNLIIWGILILICALIGNYVQHHKYDVKEKLKKFIDKL